MMGSTIRDLGNTIKEAKNFLKSRRAGELDLNLEDADDDAIDGLGLDSQRLPGEEEEDGLRQMSACLENADEEDQMTNRDEINQVVSVSQ